MATTYTTNYNLGKQENHADKFDMDVITDNADKIDAALTGLQSSIDGKQATLTTAQLAAVNSGITAEKLAQDENNILLLWQSLLAIPNVSTLNWGSLQHAENVGTITVNGAVGSSAAFIGFPILLSAGTYKFSGCPAGGDFNTYSTSIRANIGGSTIATETGSGGTFTLSASQTVWYNIRLGINYTADNLVFKPLIQV